MLPIPKRDNNVDTYKYLGEPVFTCSLKEGINGGFLTPFRVKQISTTIDDYLNTPDDDVEQGRRYSEGDFARRLIEIRERELYRVQHYMGSVDQAEKTLVFGASQEHAAVVRDLNNQEKTNKEPAYCVRVTVFGVAALRAIPSRLSGQ